MWRPPATLSTPPHSSYVSPIPLPIGLAAARPPANPYSDTGKVLKRAARNRPTAVVFPTERSAGQLRLSASTESCHPPTPPRGSSRVA
jgi:hypothetical protein